MSDISRHDNPALTDVDFWLNRQEEQFHLAPTGTEPPWHAQVSPFLPRDPEARCLEIGVFPGRFLLYFAKRHEYQCTGIDTSPRLSLVDRAFRERGAEGNFIQADFATWVPDELYDVVFSCGFVEHFGNYDEIILRHWDCVRPGGLLVLSVPVMSLYRRLIWWLYCSRPKRQKHYASHNLEIMNAPSLHDSVSRLPGNRILGFGYLRNWDIFLQHQDEGFRKGMWRLMPMVRWIERLGRRWGRSSRWYSPTAYVAARREE